MARSETRLSAAKRGADHEAYSVLVDQPGREQQAETDRPGGSAVAFMVCGGLAAQGAAFVLLRSYLISEMCDSQVLALSEVFKMLVSLVFLDWSEARRLSERWHVAVIPVAVYGVMNLLSFWSMKRLPATLSIVIVQQKLVFTAICSRVFLGRALLTARSFALAALVFGCISITAYEREAEDSRTFEQQLLASSPSGAEEAGGGGTNRVNAAVVSKSINLLAVLGLTVETALSGLISVYMQVGLLYRVFALLLATSALHPIPSPSPSPSPSQPNHRSSCCSTVAPQSIFQMHVSVMWRRNVQLSLLSVLFYVGTAAANHARDGSCAPAAFWPDTDGLILAVTSAAGGLLVALSILYSGAVGKVVATSASIALTVFGESAFVTHALPNVVQTSLCASVLNAVVMYSALPE